MAARTADKVRKSGEKGSTQGGETRQRSQDDRHTTQQRVGQRSPAEKHPGRPHPEVPPRKRPRTPPPPELEPEEAQRPDHDEPASACVPVTQKQALQELVRRAGEGNEACLAGLRDLLDKNPQIWQAAGNVSALAERHWIEVLASGNALAEESIPRRLKQLKAELLGSNPSPLETLLVDVIGVNWLAAQHGEIAASRQDASTQQIASRLRRAESGQRRLLRAVKTLAVVRTLLPRSLPEPAKKAR